MTLLIWRLNSKIPLIPVAVLYLLVSVQHCIYCNSKMGCFIYWIYIFKDFVLTIDIYFHFLKLKLRMRKYPTMRTGQHRHGSTACLASLLGVCHFVKLLKNKRWNSEKIRKQQGRIRIYFPSIQSVSIAICFILRHL